MGCHDVVRNDLVTAVYNINVMSALSGHVSADADWRARRNWNSGLKYSREQNTNCKLNLKPVAYHQISFAIPFKTPSLQPWSSKSVLPDSGAETLLSTTLSSPMLGTYAPLKSNLISSSAPRLRISSKAFCPTGFFQLTLFKTPLSSTARNSHPLEVIGTYDPIPKPDPYDNSGKLHKDIKLDSQRAKYWIGVGAQPTDTAWRLLSMVGILPKKHFAPKESETKGSVNAGDVKIR